jgi:chaperone modulatory protein CbpM
MSEKRYHIVLQRSQRERVTLEVLATSAGLHPALVESFVEFGLIEPVERVGTQSLFDSGCVMRLHTIMRLRHDLGANLPGIAVILDMLDRLNALQRENTRLRDQR